MKSRLLSAVYGDDLFKWCKDHLFGLYSSSNGCSLQLDFGKRVFILKLPVMFSPLSLFYGNPGF